MDIVALVAALPRAGRRIQPTCRQMLRPRRQEEWGASLHAPCRGPHSEARCKRQAAGGEHTSVGATRRRQACRDEVARRILLPSPTSRRILLPSPFSAGGAGASTHLDEMSAMGALWCPSSPCAYRKRCPSTSKTCPPLSFVGQAIPTRGGGGQPHTPRVPRCSRASAPHSPALQGTLYTAHRRFFYTAHKPCLPDPPHLLT